MINVHDRVDIGYVIFVNHLTLFVDELGASLIFIVAFYLAGTLVKRNAKLSGFERTEQCRLDDKLTEEQVAGSNGHLHPAAKRSCIAGYQLNAFSAAAFCKHGGGIVIRGCLTIAQVKACISCRPVVA